MSTARFKCLCWAILASSGSFAAAQEPEALQPGLQGLDAYATELAARDQFSGVVAVEQRGVRVYAKAFGLADRAARIPITLATRFFVPSQTQMFTGVAVLQLVEAGKLRFDATVDEYVAGHPNRNVAENVTIGYLYDHRDGSADVRLRGHRNIANRGYSNYGLVLLNDVVDRVTGSYRAYVEEHVFRAAGMSRTRFADKETRGVAVGYTVINGLLRASTSLVPAQGAPDVVVSTAEDELRFLAASSKGGEFISHAGGAPGSSIAMAYDPEADVAAVCLSNRDPPACEEVLARL
jgi:D-alanyl-D-alanine carboxypeptidase